MERLCCFSLVALPAIVCAVGCTDSSLYCDEQKPCSDPAKPFCDLRGEYEASGFHGRTCIPCPDGVDCTGLDAMPDAPTFDASTVDAPVVDAPLIDAPTPDAFLPDAPPGMYNLVVIRGGTGAGVVSSMPTGIDCGATCSASFSAGAPVTLTSAAAGGSTFIGWTGDCSGQGACALTMDADHTIGATFNTSGDHLWSRRFGSAADGQDVAFDSSGNVFVVGWFTGTINFGGSDIVSDSGSMDIFVAKLSPAGLHLWSKRFGGTTDDSAYSVGVDSAGNPVIAGRFTSSSINFGGPSITNRAAGGNDVFVAKLDGATGTHLWSFGAGGSSSDVAWDLAVAPSSDIIIIGEFSGTADFGGGNLTSAGFGDIFLAWYSSTGAYQRSYRFGSSTGGEGFMNRVAVDTLDYVYIAGSFQGTVSFVPGGGATLSSAGNSDIYLAKYSPAGAHQWSKSFGGTGSDTAMGVAVASSGSPVITGNFNGAVDFNPGVAGGDLTSISGGGVFLASYYASGGYAWARNYGSGGGAAPYRLAVDGGDRIVIAGGFDTPTDFGGGSISAGGGFGDIFVASYSGADGAHRWSKGFGSGSDTDSGSELARGVAVDPVGNVAITGRFVGSADFGGGVLTTPGLGWNVFLAKYGP